MEKKCRKCERTEQEALEAGNSLIEMDFYGSKDFICFECKEDLQ